MCMWYNLTQESVEKVLKQFLGNRVCFGYYKEKDLKNN